MLIDNKDFDELLNLDIDAELERRMVEAAKHSLEAYVHCVWEILEPETELKWNWHLSLVCEYLEAVTRGEIKRLIINIPPRSLKSMIVTVMWPTWEWIKTPGQRYIFSSYSQSLSVKHSIDRRRLMQSNYYAQYFASFNFTTDQNIKTEYENDHRGHMIATSTGGTITGKGGNRIIIDDPHNPKQALSDIERQNGIEYFKSTLKTRLDDKKKGVIVLVMQRLHETDLTGYLLEGGGWVHLKLQGQFEQDEEFIFPISKKVKKVKKGEYLHTDREGPEEHAQQLADLGSYTYNAQYQQRPAPPGGNMFKRVNFNFYNVEPAYSIMTQSWDCTFKGKKTSDYVAGQVWVATRDRFYLMEMVKDKLGFVKTKQAMKHLYDKYRNTAYVWVEDKANGSAVIDELAETIPCLVPVEPEGGKEARANACTGIIESGKVYLPCISDPTRWNETPAKNRTLEMYHQLVLPHWVDDFVESCCLFPNATHDDDVDAMTQALIQLRKTTYITSDDIRLTRQKVEAPDF